MTQKIIGFVAGLALLLSIVGLVGSSNQSEATLGRKGTSFPNGLSVSNGCYQIYATSTDTVGKFSVSLLGATSTFPGAVFFSYGACL